MIDYIDDFVADTTCEEYYSDEDYRDFDYHDTWYDVEASFCEEMEIEPEVYED